MEPDPVQASLAALQQAGWHIAPTASPWEVVTQLHADRWWSGQLVDIAVLDVPTGLGLLQRVQITVPANGLGPPQHHVMATTGLQPLAALPAVVTSWPPPPELNPDAVEPHHPPANQ